MFKKIAGKEKLLMGLLFGILLLVIAFPEKSEKTKELQKDTEKETKISDKEVLEQELEEVLSKISGVGKTKVLITYRDSGELVVEKDSKNQTSMIRETDSTGGSRITTEENLEDQTIYNASKEPYVIREKVPQVEGVLVVAEGGGNVEVKNQIIEAVQALFDVEIHKISIMRMEESK